MAARKKKPGQTQAERDRLREARIERFIDESLEGQITCTSCREKFSIKELNPAVVQLVRISYSKLRPDLSSQEQTSPDPFANMNRDQVLSKLRLLLKNSELARELGVMPIPEQPETGPQPSPEAAQNGLESPDKPTPIH